MDSTQTQRETRRVDVPTLTGTIPVFFRCMRSPITPRFLQIRRDAHSGRDECCVVCRMAFKATEHLVLVLGNQALFPNCMAHHTCVEWDDLVTTAVHIREEWRAAQQYAHWF